MDSQSRTHQRRAAHDPESAARALQDRVRAGALTPEQLLIAAVCGDEGAGLALDRPRAETLGKLMAEIPDTPVGTEALTRGALAAWGRLLASKHRDPRRDWSTQPILAVQLAAGEEWARTGDLKKWAVDTWVSARLTLPKPSQRGPNGPFLAKERMTRSISCAIDTEANETRIASLRENQYQWSDPVSRAEIAEKVRAVVARRIVAWVLEGKP
jgi:hypothetical protein